MERDKRSDNLRSGVRSDQVGEYACQPEPGDSCIDCGLGDVDNSGRRLDVDRPLILPKRKLQERSGPRPSKAMPASAARSRGSSACRAMRDRRGLHRRPA